MNLLVVSDYGYSAGGIEQFVLEFLERASRKVTCDLIAWTTGTLHPPGQVGVHAIDYGDIRSAWAAMDAADAIVVVTSFNTRMLAKLAADYLNVNPRKPSVVVVQTSEHSDPTSSATAVQEDWLRQLAGRTRRMVAVSEEVEKSLIDLLVSADIGATVVVIENAARISANPRPRDARRQVSFIGRPHPQKGFDLFERLATDLESWGLQFAANTVSIDPPIHIPAITYSHDLRTEELLSFFDATDLLVAPYIRADGLPLALLEAINCGVPVLGFDSPGVGQLLRRHGQVTIEPTYAALRSSVLDWKKGSLTITAPRAGMVASWDTQIDSYLDLIDEISR